MFHPFWHYLFDVFAYGASALIFRAQLRAPQRLHSALESRSYWWSLLAVGALPFLSGYGLYRLSKPRK